MYTHFYFLKYDKFLSIISLYNLHNLYIISNLLHSFLFWGFHNMCIDLFGDILQVA